MQPVFLNVENVVGLAKRFDTADVDSQTNDWQLVILFDRRRIIANQLVKDPFPHSTNLEALRLRFDLTPKLDLRRVGNAESSNHRDNSRLDRLR